MNNLYVTYKEKTPTVSAALAIAALVVLIPGFNTLLPVFVKDCDDPCLVL